MATPDELKICPPCWDHRDTEIRLHGCIFKECDCPCNADQCQEAYETFLRREAKGLYSDDRDTMIDTLCAMLDMHVWTYTTWRESLGTPMFMGDRRLDGIGPH